MSAILLVRENKYFPWHTCIHKDFAVSQCSEEWHFFVHKVVKPQFHGQSATVLICKDCRAFQNLELSDAGVVDLVGVSW